MLLLKILLILLSFMIFVYIFKYGFDRYNLVYIKSTIDNNYQLVRNMSNKEKVADLMAQVKVNIKKLLEHLKKTYPKKQDVIRLVEKFNPDNIKETDMGDSGTSYSVNKGSELSLCLRDKDESRDYPIHDLNTIMFVTIHEISHLASKSFGHNGEFGNNFTFLLKEASTIGIYSPEDYKSKPKQYCSIEITSNPLF